MYYYLTKCLIEAILRSGNHFYHECFLQYFEVCRRTSSFHLNNLNNEVCNDSILDVIPTAANWIRSILKIVPNLLKILFLRAEEVSKFLVVTSYLFHSMIEKRIFFLSGFSSDTDNLQDSKGRRDGREGTIFYSNLPLPPAHQH